MNHESIFDLCIVGGGPAGVAAGVYAARKKINAVLITENFRGQSAVSSDIQNWIGEISISGDELHKKIEKQIKHYSKDITIKEKETVKEIKKEGDYFHIKTSKSEIKSKTVLITTGSARKKLQMKGADDFDGKGIVYCATCDAPLFQDMDVAVIGGGNSAFEAVNQLLTYAKSITILQRSEFRAEPITIEKTLSNPKVKAITNIDLLEVKGDSFVSSLVYKDKMTG